MSNFSWSNLGTITSNFGNRDTGIPGATTDHKGIDIVLNNSNVPAIVGGVVIDKGTNTATGNFITIQQNDGYIATYQHLAQLPSLSVGAAVDAGSTIGVQGSTGISSGAHLHYQIKDSAGNYVDPMTYEGGAVISTPDGSFAVGNGGALYTEGGSIIATPDGYVAVGDSYSGTMTGLQDKAENVLGTVIKVCALIFVGVVAAFLFFKAFDIKLL